MCQLLLAVITHHGQKQLTEERVYFGWRFQRKRSPSWQTVWQQAADMVAGAGSWEFTASTTNANREKWKLGRRWCASSCKAIPLKGPIAFPKQYHPLGTKYPSKWACAASRSNPNCLLVDLERCLHKECYSKVITLYALSKPISPDSKGLLPVMGAYKCACEPRTCSRNNSKNKQGNFCLKASTSFNF